MAPTRLAALARSPRAAPLLAALAGALALATLLGDAWIGATIFAYRDMHRVYLPARRWFAERLRAGAWPEWYPFDGLGGSFAGEVVTGAFHPTAALHLVLPDGLALNLSVGLAHAAALAGLALLLRRWGAGWAAALAGGLAFSLSGYLVSLDCSLPYLLAASAIPWCLSGLERGEGRAGPRLAVSALALASMALAGDPQAAVTAAGLCTLWALFPPAGAGRLRALARLVAIGAASLLASGIQVLPALSGFAEAGLAEGFDRAQTWSLAPVRLLDLVAPLLFAGPAAPPPVELLGLRGLESLWADSLFVGAPVLGLALVAVRHSPRRREVALLGALAAASLLVALGAHAPFYGWLQRAFPPWRAFRYPEKTMAFFSFALAALAGLGAQAALDAPRARRTLLAGLGLCLGLTLLAAGLASGDGSALRKAAGAGPEVRGELAAVLPFFRVQALLGVELAALALALVPALLAGRAAAAAALVAAVGGTCLLGNRGLSRGYRVEPAVVFREPRALQEIRRLEPRPYGAARFYAVDEYQEYPEPVLGRDGKARAMIRYGIANLARGTGALFELEGLVGYLPLSAAGRAWRVDDLVPGPVYLRAFNARFLIEREPGAKTIEDSFRVEEIPGAGARVRLVQAIAASGEAAAGAALRAPGFDPVAQAVVEGEGFAATAPREASLAVLEYSPERIAVRARSLAPCALFVADRFAPGWAATVDRAPATIVPADLVGRAVALPAGEHEIVLAYRMPGLRAGALLSLGGLAACAGLALGRRRAPRRRPDA